MILTDAERQFLTSQLLEIRGTAEAVAGPQPADAHLAPEFIRIRPRRVVSFNVEPGPPVLQGQPAMQSRDVG
jgi:hypothetical protein